jgi:hypothetical protein
MLILISLPNTTTTVPNQFVKSGFENNIVIKTLLVFMSVLLAITAAVGVTSLFVMLRKRKQNSFGLGVGGQPLITEESLCGQTLHDIIEMTTSGK